MAVAELLRVLIIDDDEDDFLILRHALSPRVDHAGEAFDIAWASDWAAGLTALRTGSHDVFLVDYKIGGESGIDLLRAARNEGVRLPMIMLTGDNDPELSQEALAAGAVDFLVKGRINGEQLSRALRYAAEHSRKDAKVDESRQAYQAMFDKNPIPAWTMDIATGRILSINQAMTAVSGFTQGELTHCDQLQVQAATNNSGEPFINRLRTVDPTHGEWHYLGKDNQLRWADISSQPISVDGLTSRLVFAIDITRQKILEEKLIASERRLSDAASNINGG